MKPLTIANEATARAHRWVTCYGTLIRRDSRWLHRHPHRRTILCLLEVGAYV
jgi:hypothetical protein